MESFNDVLGEGIEAGLLSGTTKNYDADYLFSTVQMMSKPDIMQRFGEGYFDYICLDETHRSGAESYQRIINYFKPKFLLGMTATPERTDGFDIYISNLIITLLMRFGCSRRCRRKCYVHFIILG